MNHFTEKKSVTPYWYKVLDLNFIYWASTHLLAITGLIVFPKKDVN